MRIVVKVGSSTLAHATGQMNIRRVERLCKVMSDLKNAGNEDHLVSRVLQIRQDPAQSLHPADIQPPGLMGEGGGAHLHHDAVLFCFLRHGLFLSILHSHALVFVKVPKIGTGLVWP